MKSNLLFFLFPIYVQAYSISSSYLEFQGHKTLLKGNVSLCHHELKVQSDEAYLEKNENDYGLRKIELNQKVRVDLHRLGYLLCDYSLIDFETRKGLLSKKENKILYHVDLFFQNQSIPFSVKCNEASFTLGSVESNYFNIEEISLMGDLETSLEEKYNLEAQRAHLFFDNQSSTPVITSIELFNSLKLLELNFPTGVLKTDQLKMEINNEALYLGKTQGVLHYFGKTNFTCEEFSYFDETKTIKISGPILIENENFGFLKTQNHITIEKFNKDDITCWQSITIDGPFHLEYEQHRLESPCFCKIDQKRKTIQIDSTQSLKPIEYRFDDIFITSSQLEASFDEKIETINEIIFKGNVWIKLKEPIQNMQFLSAHKVTLHPKLQKIKIQSTIREKILFWTKDEQAAMTADELEIDYDSKTKKKSCHFKGVSKMIFNKNMVQ